MGSPLMRVVIDSSVALTWAFDDEATTRQAIRTLELVRDDGALVPPLFRYEIANALVAGCLRERISRSEAAAFLGRLDELPLRVSTDAQDGPRLLAAGADHRLTAYDAAYLVLAQDTGSRLATNDVALRKAAKRAGVALV